MGGMGIGSHTWIPDAVEKATDLAERLLSAVDVGIEEVRRRVLKLAATFAPKGDDAIAIFDNGLRIIGTRERVSEGTSNVFNLGVMLAGLDPPNRRLSTQGMTRRELSAVL